MPLRTPLGKKIKQHLPTNISLAPSTSLSRGQVPKTPSFAQQRCEWSQHNANSNLSFKFNLHFLLAPLSSPHIWNKFSLFNEGRVMSFCNIYIQGGGRGEEWILVWVLILIKTPHFFPTCILLTVLKRIWLYFVDYLHPVFIYLILIMDVIFKIIFG